MKLSSILSVLFAGFQLIGFSQSDSTTDYSIEANWAILPGGEKLEFVQDEPYENVDVFYLYPTLLVSDKDPRWNFNIDDSVHRDQVVNSVVKFQASAWANAGNLYVPFYRQGHIRCYHNLESGGRDSLLIAYSDVRAAFMHYMEHYNNGHAIILAGHSQGSTHLSLLLSEFFDEKPLKDKLIAAYLPGIGLDEKEYKSIPLMKDSTQTGGFVVWNTFKKHYETSSYLNWYQGKAAINPVTWDESALATRDQHQGFLFSNGKMYEHSFKTHLIDGGVWINVPHFPYRLMSFTMKNYHIGDVNLFWEDIRINARLRTRMYLEANN